MRYQYASLVAIFIATLLFTACENRTLPVGDSGVADSGVQTDFRPTSDLGSPSPQDAGPRECITNTECGATEYCHVEGACTVGQDKAKLGECRPRPRPSDCPAPTPAGLCGCDGQTYGSECAAHAAGVNVTARIGPCTGECGNLMYLPSCKPDEVCDMKGCGAATGTCVKKADDCATIFAPVCGCDGKTYGNDCERLGAGVPLDHSGPCKKASVSIITDKLSYASGSPAQATLENGASTSIFLGGCGLFTRERVEGGAWVDKGPWIMCGWEGYGKEVAPGGKIVDTVPTDKGGTWRLKARYGVGCTVGKPLSQAGCTSVGEAVSDPYTVLPAMQECLALDSSYATALDAAKACNPALSSPQCLLIVPFSPSKGCSACLTVVHTDQQLKPLLQEWKDLLCDEIPGGPVCKCSAPPTGGVCVNGICQPS